MSDLSDVQIENTFGPPHVGNKYLTPPDILMGLQWGIFKYDKLPPDVKTLFDTYLDSVRSERIKYGNKSPIPISTKSLDHMFRQLRSGDLDKTKNNLNAVFAMTLEPVFGKIPAGLDVIQTIQYESIKQEKELSRKENLLTSQQ
jgi:hypothetical protein